MATPRIAALALAVSLSLGAAAHGAEPAAAPAAGKHCLGLMTIDSTEILDREHIVYRMHDGTLYLNTLPHGCAGLTRHTPYLHQTSLSQVCDLDTITVLHQAGDGYMPGASCGLGSFVPTDAAAVEALKARIRADRKR